MKIAYLFFAFALGLCIGNELGSTRTIRNLCKVHKDPKLQFVCEAAK